MRRRAGRSCRVAAARDRPARAGVDAWGFEAHKYIMIAGDRPAARGDPSVLRSEPRDRRRARDRSGSVADGRLGARSRRVTSSTWTRTARIPFKELPHDYDEAVKQLRAGLRREERHAAVAHRRDLHRSWSRPSRRRRGYSRDNIKFFSAVIGHYVGDAPRAVPRRAELRRPADRSSGASTRASRPSCSSAIAPACACVPKPVGPVGNAREFIFATLTSSFPLRADRSSTPTRPAVAGREVYDDEYFAMIVREGAADPRAAAGGVDHRRRRR